MLTISGWCKIKFLLINWAITNDSGINPMHIGISSVSNKVSSISDFIFKLAEGNEMTQDSTNYNR